MARQPNPGHYVDAYDPTYGEVREQWHPGSRSVCRECNAQRFNPNMKRMGY